jgi:hypothetical protein
MTTTAVTQCDGCSKTVSADESPEGWFQITLMALAQPADDPSTEPINALNGTHYHSPKCAMRVIDKAEKAVEKEGAKGGSTTRTRKASGSAKA